MMRKLLLTFIVYVQKVARKDLSLNYFLSSSLLKAFHMESILYRKRYFWFISLILKRLRFGGWPGQGSIYVEINKPRHA